MKEKVKETADVVKTTIRIRRDLWNLVLHRAVDENCSQQAIVEKALVAYMAKKAGRA